MQEHLKHQIEHIIINSAMWLDKKRDNNSLNEISEDIMYVLDEFILDLIGDEKDSPKGYDHECECYADWTDNDEYNNAKREILNRWDNKKGDVI